MSEETTEPKLLECPFCRSAARINGYLKGSGSWEYRIDCSNTSPQGRCKAIATSGYKNTLEEAIEAWNTRTSKIDTPPKKEATDEQRAFVFGYQAGVLAMGTGNVREPDQVFEDWKKLSDEAE